MSEISKTHVKIHVGDAKSVGDITVFVGYRTTGCGWCDSLAVKTADIARVIPGTATRFKTLILSNNAMVKGFKKPGDAVAFSATYRAGDTIDVVKAIDYPFSLAYRP